MNLGPLVKRARSPQRVRRVVSAAIIMGSLVPMAILVAHESEKLRTDQLSLRFEFVGSALLLAIVSNLGGAVFWRTLVVTSGTQLSLAETLRIWCLSTPAKYGLGALTQYASRVYLAVRAGAEHKTVLVSLSLELALIAFSGVVVLLLFAPAGSWLVLPESYRDLALIGPPLAVIAVISLPLLASRVTRLLPDRWHSQTGQPIGNRLRVATFTMIANWLLYAATTFVVLRAIAPIDLMLYPVLVFVVTLSILLGLIAITPLGLGVREVAMTLLLAQVAPVTAAATTAVLHRLITVVAEFLCVASVLLLNLVKRSRQRARVNADSDACAGNHLAQ